ncbi:MAG TPA: TolC family protein [Cyclobacteriaceae bacterium]|mgnify:CR=1 FL=1|nr:TolC family protein [Cyclobacteriaceae bacterium]HRK54247.1 TolC family protein [Cyclobacteriaceae bacterium]
MLRFLLIFFIAFTTTYSSFGQDENEEKEWTLQECIKVALDNNLNVRRGLYNVESFKVGLFQSKMSFLPTLNAGSSYGQNFGRAVNPVSNTFVNRNSSNINIQANSSLTLFNGLRLQNSFRQSQRDYQASEQDLEKAKNDVTINVVTLYVNVIFNQELFENANYQLNSSQQQLERIKKQVAVGGLPKGDELNQEAQVATNEVNLINQENALNFSLLQLKQAMQLPGSTPMKVQVPDLELEDLILDANPDVAYEMALQNMPEIKSAMLKVESAELALKASKGGLYPRLSLNGSAASNYSSASDQPFAVPVGDFTKTQIGQVAGTNEPVYSFRQENTTIVSEGYSQQDQLKDNLFKQVNLSLSIPLFNGWQNKAGVQRAAINKEIADITVQETKNGLRQTIETAYNDALAALRSYSSSLRQVNAREEAYRMSKQRFELGAINYFEYQISENDLFQAKSDLARAKYNFIFKKKILDFYQGKPVDY